MTYNDELAAKYPDLLRATGEDRPRDPELALLIADLDSHFGATPPPLELEERIAAALKLRAAEIERAAQARQARQQTTTRPEYLRTAGGGREAGRGGRASMPPRRISTIAAAVAAVLVVSLIGILLFSRSGPGSSGSGAFQQRLLDLGGTELVLGRAPGSDPAIPISADVSTIQHRLAELIDPADTQVLADSASGYLIIYIAGRPGGLQQALQLIRTTGELNIINTGSTPLSIGTDVTGMTCTTTCASGQYKIEFTGAELNPSSISAGIDQADNQPMVQFEFQGAAQDAFSTYTHNNIGNYLTITLDNKVIESAVIQSQITGLAEISGGNMTITDAQNLASLLKSGVLPVQLKVISETSFQPGTPAPTVVSCSTPTPTPAPATPFATPTATLGNTGAGMQVPNVVGEQYATAVLNVEQVGLQAVGVAQVDPHIAPGYVLKTSPPAGTLVPATQVVTIYYSALQPAATAAATATATPAGGPAGACATPTPFPTAIATATAGGTPVPPETPTPTPSGP
jgi:hypothetical protein